MKRLLLSAGFTARPPAPVPVRPRWSPPNRRPRLATDEGPVVWQKSKSGVGFRLSDADPEPPPRPKRAAAKPLSPEDTARVLARLAPMKASAEEKSFALRDRSRPAPRPGETIASAFPPPVAPAGPPPAPATAAAPSLVRWAPEGAIEVAPHVSLTFSEPMVPVTSHGELAASAVPARINPQPEGKWRWIGTQTLLFEPKDERFPKATDYTVEIPAGTRTISGRTLDKAYNFGFKLPAVSIEQFHPQDYRTVELEPLLFARFDQRVRQKDVLAHILMKPADGRRTRRRSRCAWLRPTRSKPTKPCGGWFSSRNRSASSRFGRSRRCPRRRASRSVRALAERRRAENAGLGQRVPHSHLRAAQALARSIAAGPRAARRSRRGWRGSPIRSTRRDSTSPW